MYLRILLLLILLPIVELTLLLIMADVSNSWWVPLVFVIATGVLGAWLSRLQGISIYRQIQAELAAGRMPTDAMIDGVMIFLAGLLLVAPGVLTDLVGATVLIPPIRRFYRAKLIAWFKETFHVEMQIDGESVGRSDVIDSYVVNRPQLPPRDES